MGGAPEPINKPKRNPDRIVYDGREEIYQTGEISPIPSSTTSTTTDVSKQVTSEIPVVNADQAKKDSDVSRETIEAKSDVTEVVEVTDVVETPEKVVEEIVEVVEEVNPETQDIDLTDGSFEIDIEKVSPNPDQPRTNFNADELDELSRSIKRDGLIQPIVVRVVNDEYQIIAGERRWQASKLAGLKKIPVRVIEADDDKALELALIENLQRSDLNPIEEAYGYKRLMDRRRMTQADVAQAMSKGRSTIANALRLLELPESAQQLLFEDKITAGHARAILSIPSKEGRESLTRKLSDEKLSVRDAENLARLLGNKPAKPAKKDPIPVEYKSIAKALKEILDTNVRIKTSKGKNSLEISFENEKDLERIFDLITAE